VGRGILDFTEQEMLSTIYPALILELLEGPKNMLNNVLKIWNSNMEKFTLKN